MGIKRLYNDNLRKLTNEHGDVSVMGEKTRFPAFQEFISNKCSYFQRHIQNDA